LLQYLSAIIILPSHSDRSHHAMLLRSAYLLLPYSPECVE